MRQWRLCVLPVTAAIALSAPAAAQVSKAFNVCENKEPASADVRIETCSKLIELGGLTSKNFSRLYNNRGVAYADKNDFAQATRDYDEALRRDPDNAVAYNNRGVALRRTRAYDLALRDLDNAIRLSPAYANAFMNRCDVYQNKGEYERAIEDCNQAIRLAPKDAVAFNARGNAYNDSGDDERAV